MSCGARLLLHQCVHPLLCGAQGRGIIPAANPRERMEVRGVSVGVDFTDWTYLTR